MLVVDCGLRLGRRHLGPESPLNRGSAAISARRSGPRGSRRPRIFFAVRPTRAHDLRRAAAASPERGRWPVMARLSHNRASVKKTVTIAGSVILATAVGLGLFLRPTPTARERLAAPASIPAIARQILRTKMVRHDAQMRTLFSRVVMLDDDGVARAAGEIFDEPALARPVAGDELNGLLPSRFFALQDELKSRSRRLVAASVAHDHAAMADEFAALAKSCVSCHQVYLHGDAPPGSAAEARP